MTYEQFLNATAHLVAVFKPAGMHEAEKEAWYSEVRDLDAAALSNACKRIIQTREDRGLPALATVRKMAYSEQRALGNGGPSLKPFPSWWIAKNAPAELEVRALPEGTEYDVPSTTRFAPTAWIAGLSDRNRGWNVRARIADTVVLVKDCRWSTLIVYALAKADYIAGFGANPDADVSEARDVAGQIAKTQHQMEVF